jgi:hypothetical protein
LSPADYGFDPLRLGSKDKEVLKYYREAELTNGRWAMAAVAGILFTDLVRRRAGRCRRRERTWGGVPGAPPCGSMAALWSVLAAGGWLPAAA